MAIVVCFFFLCRSITYRQSWFMRLGRVAHEVAQVFLGLIFDTFNSLLLILSHIYLYIYMHKLICVYLAIKYWWQSIGDNSLFEFVAVAARCTVPDPAGNKLHYYMSGGRKSRHSYWQGLSVWRDAGECSCIRVFGVRQLAYIFGQLRRECRRYIDVCYALCPQEGLSTFVRMQYFCWNLKYMKYCACLSFENTMSHRDVRMAGSDWESFSRIV